MTGSNSRSTERINEGEGPHHLDFLNFRLRCTRSVGGTFHRGYTWWKGRAKLKKIYHQEDKPVPLSYFTIHQLFYILHDIQENYLRETHIFAFGNEKFLIKLIPNDDDGTDLASTIQRPRFRKTLEHNGQINRVSKR